MDPQWAGDSVSAEEIYEELSILVSMLWDFQISLSRQLYKPDKEVAFQSNIYENIYPETTKAIF